MTRHVPLGALLLGLLASRGLCAPPKPAAAPIDLPHSYYYREMYLPQLTSGPSGLSWAPDSRELIYSMAGSLWRQKIDSGSAEQVTDGSGYDYQPDWSPDGRFIIYVSDNGQATELWLLDLTSGRTRQLTDGGAVNVEPRWSPDGQRIVWVSSEYHRHFHLFVAEVHDGRLVDPQRLSGESRSSLPRYYYSPYDHEINPTWTRDGQSVIYVSNRGHVHGTGGLWRMPAVPGGEPAELRYEETNWQARPDLSPDGQRIVYSSYLGRNWLQLWLMPASGGDPLPLTYGDWDETGARWSPDGHWIAFVSNRDGDTQLRLLRFPGGDSRALEVARRQWRHPVGTLHLAVRDARGSPLAARVVVTDAAGRLYAPVHAWTHHAEFDRNEHPFEARYFHTAGDELLEVPAGSVRVEVMKGLEFTPVQRTVRVPAGEVTDFAAVLAPLPWPATAAQRWVSADLHVHMNYGGHYRNTPAHLALQAEAEGLGIAENLIVNKEQRFPDIAYSGRGVDPASRPQALVAHGQEFHTSYWGHLGLLGLDEVLLPGYAGYPRTAAASLAPTNADVAELAHARGALVGYAHPFEEEPRPLTQPAHTDADELPVDVALGKVDYLEVVGFSDHHATAAVWYRLLNLGFKIPAGAGTDAMADYATLRGPVGLNRVYAAVAADGSLSHAAFLDALRAGRTFATNGPLLEFAIAATAPGATLHLERAQQVAFSARLRSIVPLDHVQVVCNGRVVRELTLRGSRDSLAASGTLPFTASGWCVLRAFTTTARYPILDNFVYATTSPVYVDLRGERPRSGEDARYFVAWIDHLLATTGQYPDWNSAAEKAAVMHQLQEARAVYQRLE